MKRRPLCAEQIPELLCLASATNHVRLPVIEEAPFMQTLISMTIHEKWNVGNIKNITAFRCF
jgi:hypothetical protein